MEHNGVLSGAEELLDFQVLLDPFEECFDFSAGFIEFGDGGSVEVEVIGNKSDIIHGFVIDSGD